MTKENIIQSIKNTLEIESKEIKRIIEYSNYDQIVQTVNLISKCKGKVVITGCGTSAQIARKIVHSLNCINIDSIYLNPSDAVHGSIGTIKQHDIVIFISKGGNTNELTCFIDNIKQKNAKIIYVGENQNSILGKNCDIFLKVKIETEPDEFNMLATASSITVLALFDSICIAVMKNTKFTKEQFKINHPQGAVGKRLNNGK